ncbi:SET domain-containing protein [Amylocystis lapponica]|nr:SET domain-containing protein [Amylocystis lapponica]
MTTSTTDPAQRQGQDIADLLPRAADTTRVIAETPRIIISDVRYEGAPGFLYLPSGNPDIVFVDYLPSLGTIAEWPIWTRPHPPQPPPWENAPSFRVQEVPGKGMGMVAVRPIKAGELILAERPLYAARRTLSCAADQTNANGFFYRAALRGLSSRARTIILGLANTYPAGEYDVVPGILNSNCLEIRLPSVSPWANMITDIATDTRDAEAYAGCFPTLSRANHDCTPSANYAFAPGTFVGELRAARDLRAGEEITIAYAPLCATRAERRTFLSNTRFFACACATCALPPAGVLASDTRRMRVRELLSRLEGARFPPRVPLEELRAALGWAREEGLRVEEARVLLSGSQVLTVYEQLAVAVEWAREARRVFAMVEGADSDSLRRLDDADRVHQIMATSRTTLRI